MAILFRSLPSTREWKAFLLHLRLPFQCVLAPIWLLGALTTGHRPAFSWILPFLAVHVGLYGGATAYNSVYDQDRGPIAFLRAPPPAGRFVRDAALLLQAAAVLLLAWLRPEAGAVAAVMAGMGIAYSHPRWRWKSSTFRGLAAVALGQGAFAVVLGFYGAGGARIPGQATFLAALAAGLVTLGVYPITQVYQVEEDRERGDRTLAVRYGWRAALLFSAVVGSAGLWTFAGLFHASLAPGWAWIPALGPVPLAAVLLAWGRRFDRQDARRNHDWAMAISAGSSALFWLLLTAALAAAAPPPSPAATDTIPAARVWSEDGLTRVEATVLAQAPPAVAWGAVLDYDDLPQFMPGVDSSRVVARGPGTVSVRQVGHARFIFEKSFRFTLEFRRLGPNLVHFRELTGDFDEFTGTWSVTPEDGGSRIGYTAAIRESVPLPHFLVRAVIEDRSKTMMTALRAEIERRAAGGSG